MTLRDALAEQHDVATAELPQYAERAKQLCQTYGWEVEVEREGWTTRALREIPSLVKRLEYAEGYAAGAHESSLQLQEYLNKLSRDLADSEARHQRYLDDLEHPLRRVRLHGPAGGPTESDARAIDRVVNDLWKVNAELVVMKSEVEAAFRAGYNAGTWGDPEDIDEHWMKRQIEKEQG